MTLSAISPKNVAKLLRRSTPGHGRASVDLNADFHGRRPSGDPRLDLAAMDRSVKN